MGNGEIIQVPSGDEPIPAERDAPPTLPSPFGVIHSVQDPYEKAPMRDAANNSQTPKRQGEPLDAPSNKEARTLRDTGDPLEEAPTTQRGTPSRNNKTLF